MEASSIASSIASVSTAMRTEQIQTSVSASLMKKTLDAQVDTGGGLMQMLAALPVAPSPTEGVNFDMTV